MDTFQKTNLKLIKKDGYITLMEDEDELSPEEKRRENINKIKNYSASLSPEEKEKQKEYSDKTSDVLDVINKQSIPSENSVEYDKSGKVKLSDTEYLKFQDIMKNGLEEYYKNVEQVNFIKNPEAFYFLMPDPIVNLSNKYISSSGDEVLGVKLSPELQKEGINKILSSTIYGYGKFKNKKVWEEVKSGKINLADLKKFCYFYSDITFTPKEIINGIKKAEEYLNYLMRSNPTITNIKRGYKKINDEFIPCIYVTYSRDNGKNGDNSEFSAGYRKEFLSSDYMGDQGIELTHLISDIVSTEPEDLENIEDLSYSNAKEYGDDLTKGFNPTNQAFEYLEQTVSEVEEFLYNEIYEKAKDTVSTIGVGDLNLSPTIYISSSLNKLLSEMFSDESLAKKLSNNINSIEKNKIFFIKFETSSHTKYLQIFDTANINLNLMDVLNSAENIPLRNYSKQDLGSDIQGIKTYKDDYLLFPTADIKNLDIVIQETYMFNCIIGGKTQQLSVLDNYILIKDVKLGNSRTKENID